MNDNPKNRVDSSIESMANRILETLSRHWLRYTALLVTGCLTGYAAWSYTQNPLYVVALILLAEGASLYWALRVEDYGNKIQLWASVLGSGLSWVSIALTDLASVTIVARNANMEVFTMFSQVPEWAQRTVVYVVPILAVSHGVLATLHYYFSEEASLNRSLKEIRRDADKAVKQANADAEKSMAQARAKRYSEMAKENAPLIGQKIGETDWHNFENVKIGKGNDKNPTPPPS